MARQMNYICVNTKFSKTLLSCSKTAGVNGTIEISKLELDIPAVYFPSNRLGKVFVSKAFQSVQCPQDALQLEFEDDWTNMRHFQYGRYGHASAQSGVPVFLCKFDIIFLYICFVQCQLKSNSLFQLPNSNLHVRMEFFVL